MVHIIVGNAYQYYWFQARVGCHEVCCLGHVCCIHMGWDGWVDTTPSGWRLGFALHEVVILRFPPILKSAVGLAVGQFCRLPRSFGIKPA